MKEVVGEVLQTGPDAPIVFAGDEDESVRRLDLLCQLLKRRGPMALRILFLHAVEHR